MTAHRLVWCLMVGAAACTTPTPSEAPSLTGTWRRGNDRIVSLVAFHEGSDGFAFRWVRRAADGRRRVDCSWDGACEERGNGVKVGEYRCTLLPGAQRTSASVRCEGWLDEGQRIEQSWTDDFAVEPDGRTLKCYTREANGRSVEGSARPVRTFTKISPAVAAPPHQRAS